MKTAVITGGPASGKTAMIRELRRQYPTFPEAARWVLTHAPRFRGRTAVAARGLDLQRAIYTLQTRQFAKAHRSNASWVFFDRGIPDSLAYLKLSRLACPPDLVDLLHRIRYDLVVILEPLPWYQTDAIRTESPAEALRLIRLIRQAYHQCGYCPVTIPFGTVQERVQQILKHCAATARQQSAYP